MRAGARSDGIGAGSFRRPGLIHPNRRTAASTQRARSGVPTLDARQRGRFDLVDL